MLSVRSILQKYFSKATQVALAHHNDQMVIDKELSMEELIKYPPRTKGIPVISISKVMGSHKEILGLLQRDSGFNDPQSEINKKIKNAPPVPMELNFDSLYRRVIENYLAYIHLLPASENHHHSDVGGLARHSLEVGLYSLRKSQQIILPAIGQLDEEQARKPRWQYAAFICGLLHDAGKILFDVRIYDVKSGKDWNPYLSNLLEWAKANDVSRYRVVWRPENRHKKHENLTIAMLEWILTPEAKMYLMDNSDELPIAINHALSNFSREGYLEQCVRSADSVSTERDITTQWHELIGKRRYPLESAIVTAFRRLRDGWDVNVPKGHIWVIGEDVFLAWPKTFQLVVQNLQADKIDVPVNPTRILEILEERNLVTRMDKTVTYSMFTPELEGVSGAERVIKLSWPGLLYETLPVPRPVPGVLRLNNDGKSVIYSIDGSVTEVNGTTSENSDEMVTSKSSEIETSSIDNKESDDSEVQTSESLGEAKNNEKKQKRPSKNKKSSKTFKESAVNSTQKLDSSQKSANKRGNTGNKGLVFANQQESKAVPTSESQSKQPVQNEVIQEDKTTKEPATSALKKMTKPNQKNSGYVEQSSNYLSGMMKVRDSAQFKQQKQASWLGQKKKGRLKGDQFLIELANAVANGDLGVEPGQGMFLVNDQLHLDASMLSTVLEIEPGPLATTLKNERKLDYDKLKPNQLVKRKEFGNSHAMVLSLTKQLSEQFRLDLGITNTTIEYVAQEISDSKQTSKPKMSAKSPSVAKQPKTSTTEPKTQDEFGSFLEFLRTKSSQNCGFMQKAKGGDYWGIIVPEAIQTFIKEVSPKASRAILSKELTLNADGIEPLDTAKGKKKHLLIRKELIGA